MRLGFGMIAVYALAVGISGGGCHPTDDGSPPVVVNDGPATSPDIPAKGKSSRRPKAAVIIEPVGGEPARVAVKVVRRPPEIRRGLMYRQHLPADQGMLFLMKREEVQGFWMKNTLISLDMIFITSNMMVAGVVENTEPLTHESYGVNKPSKYVLEVNAGWARTHGVGADAKVRFEKVNP